MILGDRKEWSRESSLIIFIESTAFINNIVIK